MYDHGLTAMFSILSNICTVTEALEAGQENLISASENVARLIRILVYAINMMAYQTVEKPLFSVKIAKQGFFYGKI